MSHYVTINRDSLKAAIKQRLLAQIAAVAAGDVEHGNHDPTYRPARWWADTAHTQRHTLSTSAALAVTDEGITITLHFSF